MSALNNDFILISLGYILLFQIIALSNQAGQIKEHFLNDDSASTQEIISIYGGVGYSPIKLFFGSGYYFGDNKEITLSYGDHFMPVSTAFKTLMIGMRIFDFKTSTIYAFEVGGSYKEDNDLTTILGFNGFHFESNIGHAFSFNETLKLFLVCRGSIEVRKKENLLFFFGLDLSLVYLIKF
ncbi:MAG: hypothetical protein HXY50_03295 [Ignavibacteriaceae bacterium]|nr:hypothetical protein [Ignavibacteriaceae bacterium]